MRIAVTGATGNVGTALLRQLADEPDIEVVGIARRLPPADTSPYEGWSGTRSTWANRAASNR
ncbi:hypothetical protein GCM10027605_71970 [Micromonospora zhanjiangensis]